MYNVYEVYRSTALKPKDTFLASNEVFHRSVERWQQQTVQ